jgi:lipid-binding SYLF domain-containing protein
MSQTKWDKTKVYSKRGFDKAWHTLDRLGKPVNRLSNKLGAEAFWPTTLEKESDKAARILRSFCKDGFYADISEKEIEEQLKNGVRREDMNLPRGKQRVIKKIPASVIKNAKGLAIFTTMRTGLWLSGSGGSGVLVARNKETGEWSPPSGIMTQTLGLGFLVGVDIYDCVVVINTYEALESFKAVRCTLGGEATAMTGPVGVGGLLDSQVHKRPAPVWTYIKGRGFYAGVQLVGTVIIERCDENERFYGERIPAADILAGKVRRPPLTVSSLMETLKAAQGDADVDEALIPPAGETPGDMEIAPAGKPFGIPDNDDPDPFGVKALENEGVLIREAGSRRIPSLEIFEFRPSPSSPVYRRSRWSVDHCSGAPSWRSSVQSAVSNDRGTQTDESGLRRTGSDSSGSRISSRSSRRNTATSSHDSISDDRLLGEQETNEEHGDYDAEQSVKPVPVSDHSVSTPESPRAMSPSFTRARLVTIPKRVPPALPPRHPSRVTSPVSVRSSVSSQIGRSRPISPVSEHDSDGLIGLAEILRSDDFRGSLEGSLSPRGSHRSDKEKEKEADGESHEEQLSSTPALEASHEEQQDGESHEEQVSSTPAPEASHEEQQDDEEAFYSPTEESFPGQFPSSEL